PRQFFLRRVTGAFADCCPVFQCGSQREKTVASFGGSIFPVRHCVFRDVQTRICACRSRSRTRFFHIRPATDVLRSRCISQFPAQMGNRAAFGGVVSSVSFHVGDT